MGKCAIFIHICDFIKTYAISKKDDTSIEQHIRHYWAARLNQPLWIQCKELFKLDTIKDMNENKFQGILQRCRNNPQNSIEQESLQNQLSKYIPSLDWKGMSEQDLQEKVNTFCDEITHNLTTKKFQRGEVLLQNYQYIIEEIIKQNFIHNKSWHDITKELAIGVNIPAQTISEWIPTDDKRQKEKTKKATFTARYKRQIKSFINKSGGKSKKEKEIRKEKGKGSLKWHTKVFNSALNQHAIFILQNRNQKDKTIKSINPSKNRDRLQAISLSLCDPTFKLWEKPYTDNWEYIEQCIECFKRNYLAKRDIFTKLPTLSKLIKTPQRMSSTESNFLAKIKQNPEKHIQNINNITKHKDTFLLQALKILYDKAEYQLIDYYLIDKILTDLPCNNNKQYQTELYYFLAHFYGIKPSPNYIQSARFLNKLTQQDQDNFDLQTALISNLLRSAITDNTTQLNKALSEGLEGYSNIFQIHPHYYPGINYAYMISIYEKCFNKIYEEDSINDIYTSSKPSIAKASKQNQFWAMISDIEFQALQGKVDSNAVNAIMRDLKPTKDQLLRTLRQIDFYIDTLESFGKEDLVEESIYNFRQTLQNSI